jgi:hypothetical protein
LAPECARVELTSTLTYDPFCTKTTFCYTFGTGRDLINGFDITLLGGGSLAAFKNLLVNDASLSSHWSVCNARLAWTGLLPANTLSQAVCFTLPGLYTSKQGEIYLRFTSNVCVGDIQVPGELYASFFFSFH